MADNVAITAGSGTNVAADDISSVFYQRMKTTLGPDGTATADWAGRADGTDGIAYVDPRPLLTAVSVTPTISTSAYAAGDNVGGIMEFTSAVRGTGDYATIRTVVVSDDDSEDAALDLWLFDQTLAGTATDNAAFDPDDADLDNLVGKVAIAGADYGTFTDNSAAVVQPDLRVKANATSLFGVLVTSGTPTYTATTDLTVKLIIEQH